MRAASRRPWPGACRVGGGFRSRWKAAEDAFLFRASPSSVPEHVLEALGGQGALAPSQEEVGARGTYPVLKLRLKRAELEAEQIKHPLGVPFLTPLFPDLAVPTVDVFSQHSFKLL